MKNWILFALIWGSVSFLHAQEGTIRISITGIENTKGIVSIGLYNNEADFPDPNKYFRGTKLEPSTQGVQYTFKGLPDGVYAIAVWHDENKNGEIDTNIFGAPIENYGFSKNLYGTFGPPKFKEVSFRIENGEIIDLSINLE